MNFRTLVLCPILLCSLAVEAAAQLTISTFAGRSGERRMADGPPAVASFDAPAGAVSAGGGRFYVADRYAVRQVAADGSLSTVAGTGSGSFTGTVSGVGGSVYLEPTGYMAWQSSNVLYLSMGCAIRRIDLATGIVTEFAGAFCAYVESTGTDARFNRPLGIAVAPDGTLYVADSGNHVIRKITPGGATSLFAGRQFTNGFADGAAASARFHEPTDVALDGAGNLYVADQENRRVRKITPGGEVSTLAGQGTCGTQQDGTGNGACLGWLTAITTDAQNNVYVTDTATDFPSPTRVRRITPGGVVTTIGTLPDQVTGSISFVDGWLYMGVVHRGSMVRMNMSGTVEDHAGRPWPAPGLANGPRGVAQFQGPAGLDMDSGGNLFIADRSGASGVVRKIDAAGNVTTFATGFNNPSDIAVDAADNVYVCDRGNHVIWRITPAGTATVLAGAIGQSGNVEGTGAAARFLDPSGIGVSGSTVYVADTGNQRIRQIDSFGTTSLVATNVPGGVYLGFVQDVVAGSGGNLYVTAPDRLVKIDAARNLSIVSPGTFENLQKIDIDPAGNLWFIHRNSIRKVRPDGGLSTEAGLPQTSGLVNATGTNARFSEPEGIAVTPVGIFVGDLGNGVIRYGNATIPDRAAIDQTQGMVGVTRQLSTIPHTASDLQWTIVRRPANSTAALSSSTAPHPTFVPDVPDVFRFRLVARNHSGESVSEVTLNAAPPALTITSVTPSLALTHRPTRIRLRGTKFDPTIVVRLGGPSGAVVPVTFVSTTEVTFELPPAPPGTRNTSQIYVRTADNSSADAVLDLIHGLPVADGRADFDGDGREEIFWRNVATGQNGIWDMDPAEPSRIARTSVLPTAPWDWTPAAFADVNGDGHADIVWRNYHTGENAVWLLRDLAFVDGAQLPPVTNLFATIAGAGDVDGDGRADIVWHPHRPGPYVVPSVWLMNGLARTSEFVLPQGWYTDELLAVRDFDGDSRADLFWHNPESGETWIATRLAATPTRLTLPSVPRPMRPAAFGDFDGDGDSDVFWHNYETGQTAIWAMNGAALAWGAFLPTVSDLNMRVAGAARLGNDPRSAILWRNLTNGTNAQWMVSGASVSGMFLETVHSANWDLCAPR